MIYENTSKNTNNYVCPDCNTAGNFKNHGTYNRYLRTKEVTQTITISRVKCCSCNITHSIIPSEAIPYKHYAIDFAYEIIKAWIDGMSTRKIDREFNISRSTRKRYIKCGLIFLSIILKCNNKREVFHLKLKHISKDKIFSMSMQHLSRKFCEHKRLFNLGSTIKNHSTAFT